MKNINKKTIYVFLVWLILSVLTVFIYYIGNSKFKFIDIPTHFTGGILVALIINGKSRIKNIRKLFILSFLVFISWELFEIIMATLIPNQFVINIFTETVINRIQDVIMDIFGFMFFVLMYNINITYRNQANR